MLLVMSLQDLFPLIACCSIAKQFYIYNTKEKNSLNNKLFIGLILMIFFFLYTLFVYIYDYNYHTHYNMYLNTYNNYIIYT